MSHIGCKDDIWANADIYPDPPEDLFECGKCGLEFSLESDKIKGKTVFCPVCLIIARCWQKGRTPYR